MVRSQSFQTCKSQAHDDIMVENGITSLSEVSL